jgi:hypothetical protein
VPNTSHGVNTILRAFHYDKGDTIVTCKPSFLPSDIDLDNQFAGDTTYNSISRTVHYLNDTPPHPTLSQMLIPNPPTRKNILEAWEKHLALVKNATVSTLYHSAVVFSINTDDMTYASVAQWEENHMCHRLDRVSPGSCSALARDGQIVQCRVNS